MSNDIHALPACQKCRIRKVRCDREAPKCGNCAKSRIACIIVDPATGEQYARDHIRALEEREAILRERVNGIAENSIAEPEEQAGGATGGPPTVESTGSHGGFVGDGSGLGFLHRILSEARWQQERPRILNQLAARPRILKQSFPPSELPPLREAEELLQNYFTRFHIHHTFLMHKDVLQVFNSVYGASRGSVPQTPGNNSQSTSTATDQDKFRLFMVFAISATTRFRAGLCSDHPYGYFKAAEALLKTIPLIKDPEAIQNLLLVARFGMYHHIGISLWEISQACMRQCIEIQLHTKPLEPIDPLVEQHQRRIFWECYVLDRYSSGILGRPFAIAEEEISVALPVDVDDDHIVASATPVLDLIAPRSEHLLTEMSIFICFIKLRRISSRIHSTFYSGRKWSSMDDKEMQDVQSVGQTYTSFSLFKNELDAWRITVPIFADPRSLYQRSDWHDFMYHKDMLLLSRGAMHSLPSSSIPGTTVALDILHVCYLSASQVIHLYANLMDQRAITWTRSYFQVIFTAGLTVTYCISLQSLSGSETDDFTMAQDASETLGQCSRILTYFKDKMPDAGPFATVFDLLRDKCINERGKANMQNNSSSQSSQIAAQGMANGGALSSVPEAYCHRSFDNSNTLFEYQQPEINNIEFQPDDLNLSLTEDLIMQLEAGIGEYAWGNPPVEGNFWDQFPFA